MNTNGLWLVIVGGMLATYATRLSFIAVVPPERMPQWFRRGLRFVAPAVLAALVSTDLIGTPGTLNLNPGNHRLIAGAIAGLVAWRSRNAWVTILTGMVALWVLTQVFG
jgi:branched-subunit amino acid transport protein